MEAISQTLTQAQKYVADYDCHPAHEWVLESNDVPIKAIIAYLAMVFLGPMVIPVGKGFQGGFVRFVFALWNLLLGVFSTVGVLVCGGYLWANVQEKSLEELICNDDLMWKKPNASCYGEMGFFMTAFMLSKFPELLDTFFILIKGRPIVLLQWYHHASVLAYSWFAYSSATPTAMFFGTMNFAVHSVMYTYFAVSQYSRILAFLRPFITLLQLAQMFLGLAINLYTYHLTQTSSCSKTYTQSYFTFCTVLYFSYFVLFAKLFFDNYVSTKKVKKN